LSLASMRTHITQVKALLRGDIADIDGGLAQILASDGWLPDRPINVPVYMAGQGPKARALAKEIADGLISLGGPAEGRYRQAGHRRAGSWSGMRRPSSYPSLTNGFAHAAC
jgi:alkanesulfonate monooxygenase SsuD/methylene tetrahydromethanopterin reductase-like flavin-dependent oxidoreductase (luciferase family)